MLKQFRPRTLKVPLVRWNSVLPSRTPDASDASATKCYEGLYKPPDRATWMEALTERNRQLAQGKVLDSYSFLTPKTTAVGEKTRGDSFSYTLLPFKDDKWLCDSYINAFGRLRVGTLFQDLDSLAGKIAHSHCSPAEPMNVTASVDRIYMVKHVDEMFKFNFVLAGSVTWTGTSSMEISVKGYAFEGEYPSEIVEANLPKENVFLTANFTFVARNPETHKSFPINRLLPVSEQEWLEYRRAESHNSQKKLRAKSESLEHTCPTSEESKLIHSMWSASKEYGDSKALTHGSTSLSFMKDSEMSSTLIMQPQFRNRHSYMIFGGYLMRQTFELAYCASAAFAKAPPRFVSLDSVAFKSPVPVGSVLYMRAQVVYTEHIHDPSETSESHNSDSFARAFELAPANSFSPNKESFLSSPGTLIQVKVNTSVKSLDHETHKESGSFIYSFFVPRDVEGDETPGYCSVIPKTYSEMMEYVEGRRRAYDTARYVRQIS
ncbi:hypothetical protein BABINDRAFT_162073 [Babjeviella inositovora NRRL Y-12698]|uniref:HotDog ACOT-type domain-containing protein n=1 Tax=Babjeviella inositovora NRRL Y-12698 TaxID=984486 RepID=A0A1E3QNH4_9ASCO|nr:uncharacterized protein BABINDRAFT_162073 [Babjeviella inositovora NRRL Y-12698]ODQ78994.1 hypothetical protein BABINDRAFT_162073 [Babjeviella inositovora NRRL Y-12698]